MAEVILLSDTTSHGPLGDSRYMGPYIISSNLARAGFDTVVIDYFTRHSDLFNYLDQFLDSSTLIVGLSSTFLMPLENRAELGGRMSGSKIYQNPALWQNDSQSLKNWFTELRVRVSTKSPNAKIVFGGTKALEAVADPELFSAID